MTVIDLTHSDSEDSIEPSSMMENSIDPIQLYNIIRFFEDQGRGYYDDDYSDEDSEQYWFEDEEDYEEEDDSLQYDDEDDMDYRFRSNYSESSFGEDESFDSDHDTWCALCRSQSCMHRGQPGHSSHVNNSHNEIPDAYNLFGAFQTVQDSDLNNPNMNHPRRNSPNMNHSNSISTNSSPNSDATIPQLVKTENTATSNLQLPNDVVTNPNDFLPFTTDEHNMQSELFRRTDIERNTEPFQLQSFNPTFDPTSNNIRTNDNSRSTSRRRRVARRSARRSSETSPIVPEGEDRQQAIGTNTNNARSQPIDISNQNDDNFDDVEFIGSKVVSMLDSDDESSVSIEDDAAKEILNQPNTSECSICYDTITNRTLLDCCTHVYCFDCIREWSKESNACPLCRQKFKCLKRKDPNTSKIKCISIPNRDFGDSIYTDMQQILSQDVHFRRLLSSLPVFNRLHTRIQLIPRNNLFLPFLPLHSRSRSRSNNPTSPQTVIDLTNED